LLKYCLRHWHRCLNLHTELSVTSNLISLIARCVLDTTLCDKVCQWHVTGWWLSPGKLLATIKVKYWWKCNENLLFRIVLIIIVNLICAIKMIFKKNLQAWCDGAAKLQTARQMTTHRFVMIYHYLIELGTLIFMFLSRTNATYIEFL
jgi:hypothetical protein